MTDAGSKQGLSPTIIPTCNSNEEYVASQMFLHNFSAIAADYGHPSCLGNCIIFLYNSNRWTLILTLQKHE